MIDVIIGGVATGSLYAMLAVGFVLVFATTGVANFAQGSLAMVAAFIAFSVVEYLGLPIWVAVIAGLVASAATGCAIYALALRPLQRTDHLFKGVATLAIDIIIINLVRVIWGPSPYVFNNIFSGNTFAIAGLILPLSYVVTFFVAIGSAGLLHLFLRGTREGVALRAVTQDPDAAVLMGVHLPRISMLAWLIAGLLAGVAGLLLAPVSYLSFHMMSPYLVRMFAAAALGGLNSIWGAVVGGITLGVLEALIGRVLPATLIDVVSVIVLLVVLLVRPQGLFGIVKVRRV